MLNGLVDLFRKFLHVYYGPLNRAKSAIFFPTTSICLGVLTDSIPILYCHQISPGNFDLVTTESS